MLMGCKLDAGALVDERERESQRGINESKIQPADH
jgi:hypothetical protein